MLETKTVSGEPSVLKLTLFATVFAIIIGLDLRYKENIFEASHSSITELQSKFQEESSIVNFFKDVSDLGRSGYYVLAVFIMSTFLSRERFWYYIITMTMGHSVMQILKLIFHDPRPAYVWSDIWSTGCDLHFGNPSGHCIDAFLFTTTLFLDLFVPSKFSRENQPHLNTHSFSNSRCSYILSVLLIATFGPLIVVDRWLLGKHTLDQVLFGGCIGVWIATFFHFCLRDLVYSHFEIISNRHLGTRQIAKYTLIALITAISFFIVTVITAYYMSNTVTIEQV